jgi:hypothetical protein
MAAVLWCSIIRPLNITGDVKAHCFSCNKDYVLLKEEYYYLLNSNKARCRYCGKSDVALGSWSSVKWERGAGMLSGLGSVRAVQGWRGL